MCVYYYYYGINEYNNYQFTMEDSIKDWICTGKITGSEMIR